jgi:hypothetical protein
MPEAGRTRQRGRVCRSQGPGPPGTGGDHSRPSRQ